MASPPSGSATPARSPLAAPVSAAALPLAFRIGVTGTRDIPAAAEPTVRHAVADILDAVRATVERVAAIPAVSGIYASPQGRIVPFLRIVSPLAEGADRLAAEVALKRGYVLDVALPFEQPEYERDFPGSIDGFRKLLAHAGGRVLALDGARGMDEWRSYEAVGRHVVRNCDVLLAIWDPDVPAKGRGGTEDTCRRRQCSPSSAACSTVSSRCCRVSCAPTPIGCGPI